MTIKQEIDWLVRELNSVGSKTTLNGNNNHITYEYHADGKYYNMFKDGYMIGVSMSAKECVASLHMLCSIL